ncbi:WD40 repeat domain-containing protein [Solirubrobacter ginsenosidimutans]|uniref:WD40 repeat domain-containing protein n=1 Tax=Solirubrobacter ginsenosidimutans TaxID=490573 RepID=A0A9X3MQX3_9ACTN|nr:WD40 repeat domain-containing protein [Solirubrobacter ginsenosidimutans]MDA0160884.1 WD40 repeat domain-containing protein [Solirubrobacter ginsenosidimutans]
MTSDTFPHAQAFALGVSFDMRFAPDESALYVVASRLQRWDLHTGKRTHAVAWSNGHGIDVSPDGTRVVSANTSGDVIMLDAASMEQLWLVRGRTFGAGTAAVFVAGGAAFVTCSSRGDLVVRDTETGSILLHEHEEGRQIVELACSPDRERFVFINNLDGAPALYVRRWPFSEHAARVLPIGGSADKVALDDSGRLAVQRYAGLAVYDVETGAELAARESEQIGGRGIAWAPDGELAAVESSFTTNAIVGLAGDALEPRWSLELPFACAVAYSPSGALLALGSWEKGLVARRWGAGVVVLEAPPADDEEPVSVEPRDDEERQIIEYVEIEACEGVVSLEKVDSARLGSVRHDIWDVQCESTRWWAITDPLAAYDQEDHRHSDTAFSFHVGSAARLEDEDRTGSEAWSAWHRAADALADATSAADASTIGAALVTALAAAEVPDGPLTPLASGLADYVSWLAAADGASHAECELAVHSVRQLLETLAA